MWRPREMVWRHWVALAPLGSFGAIFDSFGANMARHAESGASVFDLDARQNINRRSVYMYMSFR